MLDSKRDQQPKLLNQVRQVLRLHHYSIHTERSYVDWIVRFVRCHNMRSRVVMTREEVAAVISHMDGTAPLVTKLLFCSGLRIMEAVRLRVKDIDFQMKQLTVLKGKCCRVAKGGTPDSTGECPVV